MAQNYKFINQSAEIESEVVITVYIKSISLNHL